jgi:hypothetical protein
LKTALENAQVGALDLERVNRAALAAVARAKGRQAKSTAPYEPLTIRVLASAATEACTATRGWGFFVVERTIGESNATVATRQPEADKRRRYCIELHLYTDAGSR